MLRTNQDVRVEFDGRDQLKKLRDAYVLHLLDYIVVQRQRAHVNDLESKRQENEGKVTVENVFELAGNKVDEDESSQEEPDESDKE